MNVFVLIYVQGHEDQELFDDWTDEIDLPDGLMFYSFNTQHTSNEDIYTSILLNHSSKV